MLSSTGHAGGTAEDRLLRIGVPLRARIAGLRILLPITWLLRRLAVARLLAIPLLAIPLLALLLAVSRLLLTVSLLLWLRLLLLRLMLLLRLLRLLAGWVTLSWRVLPSAAPSLVSAAVWIHS
jgi:hypothetical protein